jgi:hypothetical protein
LPDGRLALLVTEGQAHGVVAALATAALTGAFTAATTAAAAPSLDELLATLQASAEGVLRGGEPIAAFVAIVDASDGAIAWGCAGHPGAYVVGSDVDERAPVPLGGGGARLGDAFGVAMRGEAVFGADHVLVVASTGVRGGDATAWYAVLRSHAAAGARFATRLVEAAGTGRQLTDDLLAVVVRPRRGDRRSATLA